MYFSGIKNKKKIKKGAGISPDPKNADQSTCTGT
jgi:hypothetical protein